MASGEKPPEKQSRTRLTFAQKVHVLQRLENGEKQVTLAKELGCSRRALSRLKQNKAFFQQLQLQPSDSQRKSRHSVRNISLESSLTSFLSAAKRNGFPVTGSVVRQAALKIRDELLADPELSPAERASLQGFQASINWSKAFVKRRGLRNTREAQEDQVNHSDGTRSRQVTNLLSEYDVDCILSVEKLNLFYKLLPTDLLASSQSSLDSTETGRKYSLQERVVVLVASNATGSLKILPTIVWKEKLPSCFDRRPCPLPHLFHPQAWIDEDIFKTWFCSVLLPAVRQYTSKKVALLVNEDWVQDDICDTRGQVQVIGVAKSEEYDEGPLHMGAISVLRRKYRYSMLDAVIRMISCGYQGAESGFGRMQNGGGLMEGESANLLDLADLIQAAWGLIGESLIGKCWLKCGILPEEHRKELVEAYGQQAERNGEEAQANCCTRGELEEDARGLERLLMECRVAVARAWAGSTRIMELVNKLSSVGRKEVDGWFEIEETTRGLRALSSELEEMSGELGGDGLVARKGVKRNVEDVNRPRDGGGGKSGLPSVGYLMDLIAPIQSLLDEREQESGGKGKGKGGELVRSLKMELVRLKCEEEGQSGGGCSRRK